MHPLAEDFSKLKDTEVESRIQDLSKKYWQAHNPTVQYQISLFLDMYNEELSSRRARAFNQQHQNRDKGLDNLIKVN